MGWGESKESVHHACDRRIAKLEARLAEVEQALRTVHDLSLLPFNDNDRREIAVLARAVLDKGEQTDA